MFQLWRKMRRLLAVAEVQAAWAGSALITWSVCGTTATTTAYATTTATTTATNFPPAANSTDCRLVVLVLVPPLHVPSNQPWIPPRSMSASGLMRASPRTDRHAHLGQDLFQLPRVPPPVPNILQRVEGKEGERVSLWR